MKVAFLVGLLSEGSGGLATSVPSMAKALASRTNVEPHVIGVSDPERPARATAWGPYVHGHRAYGPASFHWAPSMARTLNEIAPDVVDTQGLWMNLSRVALSQHCRQRTPLVITPRGMMDPWALRRGAWRKRFVVWWFEEEHLGSARVLRALNEDEALAIRQFGASVPIAVVPNGVEAPEPTHIKDAGDRPPVIQFLGRLDPKKGLEPLLNAWALVRKDASASNWRLRVNGWGDPDYVARLQRLATDLALDRSLSVGGPVFGSAKDSALASAAGFVLPSYSEGLPMAVLEAWSWATPVLMTRACNLPGGFSAGAALEIDLEPKRLAVGLLDFIGMSLDERREMGRAGRHLVDVQYDARAVAQSLARLYAWAAGGGAVPPELMVR